MRLIRWPQMPLDLADYENKAREAIKAFWGNRAAAVAKQKELGREDQGFEFITAYNWSQVLQTAFFVLIAFITLPLPDSAAIAIGRLGLIAMLGYEWFIALVAIGAGGWIAAAMVVLDIVLGAFIVVITASLY